MLSKQWMFLTIFCLINLSEDCWKELVNETGITFFVTRIEPFVTLCLIIVDLLQCLALYYS